MIKFDVKNRLTGAVQFTADIDCAKGASHSLKLGLAVRWAVKNDANLAGANLAGADLWRADLWRADLAGADLAGANLGGADLWRADLWRADLAGANLAGANLAGADLAGADLWRADLAGADLAGANLAGANLAGADLGRADLGRANLAGANLGRAKNVPPLAIARTRILPDGDLIGWKSCRDGALVKLRIPADAKRSHAFGRKCRAEFADVLEIIGADEAESAHKSGFIYRPGARVTCDAWCDDYTQECAGGIHFFITREEAEAY